MKAELQSQEAAIHCTVTTVKVHTVTLAVLLSHFLRVKFLADVQRFGLTELCIQELHNKEGSS